MRSLTLAMIGTLFAATTAQAQMIVTRGGPGGPGEHRMRIGGDQPVFEEGPADYGVTGWRTGQWVRYSIAINMGQMPLTQVHQVSIVGQQGDRYWVETQDEFVGAMSSRGPIQKMLIPFGVIRERVGVDVIVMSPESAITRRTLLRAGPSGPTGINFPGGWTRVGEEQVTVAGGTFRSLHYRKGGEDLWISADAGPVGVVKYESETVIIELAGKGDNARSRIPYGG